MRSRQWLPMLAAMLCTAGAVAQTGWQPAPHGIGFGEVRTRQFVQMASSPELQVKVSHGSHAKPVELRFEVENGLHINSHTPHSKFLIPTVLTLDPVAGVEVAGVDYPPGVDYHFQFAPKEALNVYTGEFAMTLRVHAKPGRYVLHGKLRYQACDNRTCNPPETLPLELDLTAN